LAILRRLYFLILLKFQQLRIMIINRPYLNLTRVHPENDDYFELTISFILDERKRLGEIVDDGVQDGIRYIRITFYEALDDTAPDIVNSVTTLQRFIMREKSERIVRVQLEPAAPPYMIDEKGNIAEYKVAMMMRAGSDMGSSGSYEP